MLIFKKLIEGDVMAGTRPEVMILEETFVLRFEPEEVDEDGRGKGRLHEAPQLFGEGVICIPVDGCPFINSMDVAGDVRNNSHLLIFEGSSGFS